LLWVHVALPASSKLIDRINEDMLHVAIVDDELAAMRFFL
jgi:hypothetical protein